MSAKIVGVREIPLDQLEIGKGQVRLRNVNKEVDDLAASIAKVGLLEPIVVSPTDDPKKFEIVTGQRRFLAHQKLKKSTILAAVLDKKVDEVEAKVLSVTENLVRLDLNRADLIDVCTMLYKRYGSVDVVIQETGLPRSKVTEYVKYDRLAAELKKLVDSGEMDIKAALRAQDAASVSGKFDAAEAIKLAKEMRLMTGAQQKKIVDTRRDEPTRGVDDVIESAKSGEKITQIVVTLGANIHDSLKRFAKEEDTSMDDAAAGLIEESLDQKGYGSQKN
jgi:ParB family transcriptional regulator, chromosome partitioning protein